MPVNRIAGNNQLPVHNYETLNKVLALHLTILLRYTFANLQRGVTIKAKR
jgi:hypothetical protein